MIKAGGLSRRLTIEKRRNCCMKTLREKQEDYARLLLAEGLNLQKGQLLAIDCPVDQAWFARICAAAAYEMGCREVVTNWNDDALTRAPGWRSTRRIRKI